MPPVRRRHALGTGSLVILGVILTMLYAACATMPPLFVGQNPATATVGVAVAATVAATVTPTVTPTIAPATNTPLPTSTPTPLLPTDTPTSVPATMTPTDMPPTDTPVAESAAETEVTESSTDDGTEVEMDMAFGAPNEIPHKVVGREECSDCHQVGADKNANPASHEGWGDEVCLLCHIPGDGDVTAPPLPKKASIEFCLSCHGPYDQLIALTAGYVIGSGRGEGLEANPHAYVPHESANIIECRSCHTVHPLPVLSLDEVQTPDTNYCFAACHHEDTFEPCSDCHNE